jgi:thioredoxin 1
MKYSFRIFFLTVACLAAELDGFSQEKKNTIGPDDFEAKLESVPEVQLVDVRTPGEFSKGFIQGAFNMDVNGQEFTQQVSALDKNRPVLVYCLSGARSARAAEYMRQNGFLTVVELKGGLLQWNARKKPLVHKVVDNGQSVEWFEQEIGRNHLVLIDFFAPWCAPCKKMAPDIDALQEEHGDRLTLLKINADDNRALVEHFKVESLPGLMLFKDGKRVWINFGLAEKDIIDEQIKKNL